MSKIPCGGFELDESLALKNGKLGLAPGAGGSQADWNVTDSNDPAFIKNKPFGIVDGEVVFSEENIVWSSGNGEYPYSLTISGANLTYIGEDLLVAVDDVIYDNFIFDSGSNSQGDYTTIYKQDCQIKLYIFASYGGTSSFVTIYSKSLDVTSVKVINPNGQSIEKIDKKYLPDQVQSDWNENDSSSPAYILNKPESLGGGVTWFSLSFTTSSWEGHDSNIKKGETWSSGVSTTSEELLDAFKNGLVRAHITDKESGAVDWFGTLDGVYHYTSCGYTNDVFTFTVNNSQSAKISYTKS